MITVRFPDTDTEAEALGFLAGRFSFKSFADGMTIVPEAALGRMAAEGIRFTVEGRAAYEQIIPAIRDTAPTEAQ